MARVALVQPEKIRDKWGAPYPGGLGLSYISSSLKENDHDVLFADINVHSSFFRRVVNFRPDYVAITTSSESTSVPEFIAKYRKADDRAEHIIGGPPVTIDPVSKLRESGANFAVKGDGLAAIQQIINGDLNQKGIYYNVYGRVAGEGRSPVNVDAWKIDMTLIPETHDKWYDIITSVGCYGSCTYCSIWKIYPKIHFRSIDNVIAEMIAISKVGEVKGFAANDDNFLIKPERLGALHNAMLENGLEQKITFQARADDVLRAEKYLTEAKDRIPYINLGFETPLNSQLRRMKKGYDAETNVRAIELLRKLHIQPSLYLLILDQEVGVDTSFRELVKISEFFTEHPDYLLWIWHPNFRIYRDERDQQYEKYFELYRVALNRIADGAILYDRRDAKKGFFEGREVPAEFRETTEVFFDIIHEHVYKVSQGEYDLKESKREITHLAKYYSLNLGGIYEWT